MATYLLTYLLSCHSVHFTSLASAGIKAPQHPQLRRGRLQGSVNE